jgi:nitrite reductase/ring-hydroxylating ferredoxin subunit
MRHSALVPLEPDDIAALVDLERGTVAGRAFADDLVYDIELERVFARAWCLLCDVDRLTGPGQFVSTFTGEDPVTVVRQADGSLKVMLNSCRHRGLPVCGSAGKAHRLTCGYHGWTYDLDGRLVGVLDGDEDFRRWAEDRRLALIPITRTTEVGGLLFGTWDATWAPSLEAGGSALAEAIAAVRAEGPLERHPTPVRLEANWKVAIEVLGALAQSEDGVTLFPSFVALPSRGLVAAVHPKGHHACEVALWASARAPFDASDRLRAVIEPELEPEGPRTVVLNLKPRAAGLGGCPEEDVPVVRPPRQVDARATEELYRAWVEHMVDDSPLAGLITT